MKGVIHNSKGRYLEKERNLEMRNKRLWKNLMLAVACTVTLGTASVPVLAEDVKADPGVSVEAETGTDGAEGETPAAEDVKSEDVAAGNTVEEDAAQEKDVEAPVEEQKDAEGKTEAPVEEQKDAEEKVEAPVEEEAVSGKEESVSKSDDTYPEIVDGNAKTDGTEDVTVYLKDGTGQYKIKLIDSITLGEIRYRVYTYGFTYDAETGALTISGDLIRDAYAKGVFFNHHSSESGSPHVALAADYTFENGEKSGTGLGAWGIEYTGVSVSETAPVIIDSYQEFDGTKDLKFQFKNGTGNDEITAIKEVGFYNEDENGSLLSFWIANYGTSFTYDLANGEVTLFKHAVSAIVYDIEKWDTVSDTFGKAYMKVEYADGRTGTVFAREADEFAGWKTDWKVKILEKSAEAGGQHYVEIPEGQSSLSKADMEVLVNINRENDVIIKTSEGVYYSFEKGAMHLIDGKESYDLGLDLIKDFSQFAKARSVEIPFSEDEFGFYIQYNYSGELPGAAQITIPVDTKWAGQTLYYYEIMEDGSYRYTGQNAVVAEDGTYTVTQDHCSDYIALAKMLNTDNGENGQKPEDNGEAGNPDTNNNQGNTQKPNSDQNNVIKIDTVTNTKKNSPKTGDMSAAMPLFGTGIASLGMAISVLRRKRRE